VYSGVRDASTKRGRSGHSCVHLGWMKFVNCDRGNERPPDHRCECVRRGEQNKICYRMLQVVFCLFDGRRQGSIDTQGGVLTISSC